MLEKWKRGIDNGAYVSALFMGLSKAFDTINHNLMLVKLKVYGFLANNLNLIHSYLKNRKQKVQISNTSSLERDVIAEVPQGSIDVPLLFSLFINDVILNTMCFGKNDDNEVLNFNGVATPAMNSLFDFRNNKYNIRNFQLLSTDFRRTVTYGIEIVTYRAPFFWAKLPSEYKFAASLEEFKVKIKK